MRVSLIFIGELSRSPFALKSNEIQLLVLVCLLLALISGPQWLPVLGDWIGRTKTQ